MKLKVYNFLVNRHPGIRDRYHRFHDDAYGVKKIISWLYLLWLNFCYYFLFFHFLDKHPTPGPDEEKILPLEQSESTLAASTHPDINACVEKMMQYDVVSFDLFDTLFFRPFSEPTDVFFFIGEKFGILDFKRIRIQMEAEEREACKRKKGHTEITLEDIWRRMEREVGIPAEEGIRMEQELEEQFCYANPFMFEVFRKLKQRGKQIIVVSDMYLPKTFLQHLLEKNGYTGISQMYVSCEYGKNKADGSLFAVVKRNLPEHTAIIHVGDNPVSDIQMAEKQGIAALYYPNTDRLARNYRAYDMSPIIGGAYRGIVNHSLYNGSAVHGMEYEYGFIYGGIFVLGYCSFIHAYCAAKKIDKILFLSRDGDILKQVYDKMYPGEHTAYAYWSRAAATKLMAACNKYDYYRRFLYHKVNQGKTMEKILTAMELQELLPHLPREIKKTEYLTDRNVEKLKEFLENNWQRILRIYEKEHRAAKKYYKKMLDGCKNACAVDIGWAGSGAVALDDLVQKVWEIPCHITGIIAGTNTPHNAEPDASEMQLQSGKLVAYLYSASKNRDLLQKHDPNRDYNIFWELLLASPTRQFQGFSMDAGEEKVILHFGKSDPNPEGIAEIQQGILDFVEAYQRHFGALSYMSRISGRDAYAPMLAAASRKERYLKEIAGKFGLEVNVGE